MVEKLKIIKLALKKYLINIYNEITEIVCSIYINNHIRYIL